MRPVLTREEMRAADAAALERVSHETLVTRAGTAVAHAALRMLGGAYGRRVVVVAGQGSNGADGRVAAVLMVRARMRVATGRPNPSEGRLAARVLEALPYRLTGAQTRAIEEIRADLCAPRRMLRLLQGDVGSGKTIVALIAMSHAVEAGRQAALMAPTEILARQHIERMTPLAEAAGLKLELFTGRDTPAQRREKLARLAGGEIDIAHRHARAVSGERRLPRSRARGGRRAASFRGPSASGAVGQGRGGRSPGHDRDADPALAGAHLFRRHGRLRARREAARPHADRHARDPARTARRRGGGDRAGGGRRRPRLLGLPAGGGQRGGRSGGGGSARRSAARLFRRRASASCMGG